MTMFFLAASEWSGLLLADGDMSIGGAILYAAIVLFGLTFVFAGVLGIAKEKLRVDEDPRIPAICDVLPAANCGGCGYAGCSDFAKAVVEGRAEPDWCPVGGAETAEKVAAVLGVEVVKTFPYRPVVHCAAKTSEKHGCVPYEGVESCVEAHAIGVTQGCTYGCLGFGDCVDACDFDAIHILEGAPLVDYEKCTGCGACVRACPRDIIEMIPFKQEEMLVVACSNHEPAKSVKEVCTVGCVGCTMCQRKLAEVFGVSDNLASLDYDSYTGDEDFGVVLQKCPAKVLIRFGKPNPKHTKELPSKESAA